MKMSESRWPLKDEPGRCLFCGKRLPVNWSSGYCSFDCEQKDTNEYKRAQERAKKEKDNA